MLGPQGKETIDVRVVVLDGSPALRRGLREILNEPVDMRVVGECDRGEGAT